MHEMETTKSPIISLGMPVYNGEKYLRDALDSVLGQTFTNFELIVSDNASTDATESICLEYACKDSRIQYVRQSHNIGATSNFEYVLSRASCDYFMWVASDDGADPHFLEELYRVLDSDPEIVLAMSDVANISSSGRYLYPSKLDNIRHSDLDGPWGRQRNLFFENPTSNIFFCIYGLYRTGVAVHAELNYKGRLRYAAGSEIPFLAQIALLGRIVSVPGEMKFYRRHEESEFYGEQIGLSGFDRLKNVANISTVLISIALKSGLPVREQACLVVTVIRSLIVSYVEKLMRNVKKVVVREHR